MSDDEGMGSRQNAQVYLFDEYPDEISIPRQIVCLVTRTLYNMLHYITGE
jgi:hypothetical protein